MESDRISIGWRTVLGVFLLSAALGFAVFVALPKEPPDTGEAAEAPGERDTAPAQGAFAPGFTLTDLKGEEVDLAHLRGRPVLINFWATWCAPCRIEMPAIQDRYERYQREGLKVLAVNFDEPEGEVRAFREELGITFTVLLDPGAEVQELYRVRGYPTSFFLDTSGVVLVHHIGVMTERQLDDYLAEVGLGDG